MIDLDDLRRKVLELEGSFDYTRSVWHAALILETGLREGDYVKVISPAVPPGHYSKHGIPESVKMGIVEVVRVVKSTVAACDELELIIISTEGETAGSRIPLAGIEHIERVGPSESLFHHTEGDGHKHERWSDGKHNFCSLCGANLGPVPALKPAKRIKKSNHPRKKASNADRSPR